MFDFLDFWATLPNWIRWPIALSLIGLAAWVFYSEEIGGGRSRARLSALILIVGTALLFIEE